MRYSGLITKTRAMAGKLLTEEQLMQLTELATVTEYVNYLKETEAYGSFFGGREGIWHRGQAEAVILLSLYQDFEKLYRFADDRQRSALAYVLYRYETDLLKSLLRRMFRGETEEPLKFPLNEFIYRHMSYEIEAALKASNMAEFEQVFSGTRYEDIFRRLKSVEGAEYADYANSLDTFYYTSTWKTIHRMKKSDEKQILAELLGTRMDWQNLTRIYRSKRFYSQTQAELHAFLIPCRYRLTRQELHGMVAAEDIQEVNRILQGTSYMKGKDAFVQMEDEISYRKVIMTAYQRVSRKYPMSIAPVLKYLYARGQEIERLTTIMEGIRYQLPAKDIRDIVLITA